MKTKTFWAMVLTLSMLSATVDARDYDITAYGAKSDTTVLSTQVLQQATDARPDFVEEDIEGWDDNGHYAGGSWAPAIRHHNGLYYVYFCTPDEGLYMSTASLHFTTAGEPFPLRPGYWKGIRVGLFCYGKSGRAAFDEFTQKVNQ